MDCAALGVPVVVAAYVLTAHALANADLALIRVLGLIDHLDYILVHRADDPAGKSIYGVGRRHVKAGQLGGLLQALAVRPRVWDLHNSGGLGIAVCLSVRPGITGGEGEAIAAQSANVTIFFIVRFPFCF